jgi:hypothetical protein
LQDTLKINDMIEQLLYPVMQQKKKAPAGIGFKTEWTVSGDAAARTITLPGYNSGVFNCIVKWGDGSSDSIVTSWNDLNATHVYANNGTYTVEITGSFPSWSFNAGGDRLKITKITNWGEVAVFGGLSYFTNGFSGCSNLTSFPVLPSYITTVALNMFYGCTGLTGNLVIPDHITSIGNGAFTSCTGLNGTLTIGSGVTSIGVTAFQWCSSLTGGITIPDSTVTIGQNAFYACIGFNGNLSIGAGVTTIVTLAFYGCSGLTGNLTIPNNV